MPTRRPASWLRTVAGDEFSWILPTLGLWFSSLLLRDDQYRTWLYDDAAPTPTGSLASSTPRVCFTAMKQEVCRRHQKDANKWALDDIVYHTEVLTTREWRASRAPQAEGAFVHGLFLEGAGWSRDGQQLQESEPKTLYVPLPVMHVSPPTSAPRRTARARKLTDPRAPTTARATSTAPARIATSSSWSLSSAPQRRIRLSGRSVPSDLLCNTD